MAEQNPIKYSDLISPDDSIEKLIGQLEQLNEAYTGMADSVKAQAASVAASLKVVSGATTQGQQATRNAAQEADKLAKAYQNLMYARSQNAMKIEELKQQQKEEQYYTKLQVQLNRSVEGSYNALSAQYRLNKIALNNLTEEQRKNSPAAKKLEADTKAIYEKMKELQEATGKYSLNVGNYTNAITNAIGINSRWFSGLQEIAALTEGGLKNGLSAASEAVGAFGKKLLALLANPIVLVIAGISAAFVGLAHGIKTSEENTNALNRILAPFKRMLEDVNLSLQETAGWLLRITENSGEWIQMCLKIAESLPKVGFAFKAFNAYLDKNNEKMREGIELEKEKQALQKDGRELTKQEAKTQYEISVLRRKAAEQTDPKMQAAYLNKAIKKEREMSENRVKYIERELAALKKKSTFSQNDSELNDQIAQKEAELWNARTQAEQRSLRMVTKVEGIKRKLEKDGNGKDKKDNSVDQEKKRIEEQRKLEDARIAIIDDAIERERQTIIASYRRKIEDAKKQYGEETELAQAYEIEMHSKLADLVEKKAQQERDAEKKDLDKRLKATDEMIRKQKEAVRKGEEAISQEYELSMSYIELEDSEQKKTEMRLAAEKKRLQALLKLYEADGRTLTEAELQILRNNIEQVDKEMEKTVKGRDLYDLLGFEMDDDQKEAINEAFSVAMDNLNSYMDALVKAAEQKAQLADKEVDRARSVLDAEIEARNKGYASDVETARKELALAKKNQQQALNEQKRAQRMQEAINAAEQASSLITATANIWKSFTGRGPWGIAAAIAATALMWGSFAAAKIKAVEMTRTDSEEYGEGTVELLEGGSHQSGNDIDLGRKRNGTRRRAEGGEFFAVINKRNSRRYRSVIPDVIGSLNDGTFAQKYMRAYDDGGVAVSVQGQAPDLRGLSSDVRMIREQGEVSTTYDGNGNEVMRYKNLRRIIRR